MSLLFGDQKTLNDSANLLLVAFELHYHEDNQVSVYCGYPFFRTDGGKGFIKLLFACPKGFAIFVSSDVEREAFHTDVLPLILRVPSLARKLDDCLRIFRFIEKSEDLTSFLKSNDCVTYEEIQEFNALFQRSSSLSPKDNRTIEHSGSLGDKIKKRDNKVLIYDTSQFSLITSLPFDRHVRVRGIAGSGKTVVLVRRMAYLHFLKPELRMVYVFFTKSLKQTIKEMFAKAYKEYDSEGVIDDSTVMFFHGWGSAHYPGFYSYVCEHTKQVPRVFDPTSMDGDQFQDICASLLNKLPPERMGLFDYIFIDEAQDFPLPFFHLALRALKTNGRIIYAYDELQTLSPSASMPSKKEIFGDQVTECMDANLPICYRTPKEILVAAHAIGMGIYRPNVSGKDLFNIPEDKNIWKVIGYQFTGSIRYGSEVDLYRDSSPVDEGSENAIKVLTCTEQSQQTTLVLEEIYNLIKNDDVLPEDILVIDLDSSNYMSNFYQFQKNCVDYLNSLSGGKERAFGLNLLDNENFFNFRNKGEVTYTTIFRAKGNEANIVFVINVGHLHFFPSYTRNRIFTAMTRARFRVYLSGYEGMEEIKAEVQTLINNKFHLRFAYPTEQEILTMKTMAKGEEKTVSDMRTFIEKGRTISKENQGAFLQSLFEQTGTKNLDELKQRLAEMDSDAKGK